MTTPTTADWIDERLDGIQNAIDRRNAYVAEHGVVGILPTLVRLRE